MPAKFIQIHFLTSYPAALLNRDDVGFAKRISFGGASRIRISSQCLKRHWRTHDGQHALSEIQETSIRSRRTFEQLVYQPLVDEGVDADLAKAVTQELMNAVLGKSKKAKDSEALRTGQITVLGRPEIRYLLELARQICADAPDTKGLAKLIKGRLGREGTKNLQALKLAAGLDAAMFGRMVTSDILARGDAAVHVAHAFTVHEEQAESDYFSAVDELKPTGEDDQELGSGHIGSVELTSGLYYGYVVVDIPLLVSNLEGVDRKRWLSADRTLAGRVVESLVHLLATVSPGAKLGSTAPHSYAQFVMVEGGDAQPRTLANAFLKPVRERPDVLANTYDALIRHMDQLDNAYGLPARRIMAIDAGEVVDDLPTLPSLHELASWAREQVEAD